MHICLCPGIPYLLNGEIFESEIMSTASNSPSWRSSSPLNAINQSKELDTIIKHLSMDETSDCGVEGSEKSSPVRRISLTICNRSESSANTKFDPCKCNNNMSECEYGKKVYECNVRYEDFEEGRENGQEILVKKVKRLKKRRRSKKRKSHSREEDRMSEGEDMCQPLTRINGESGWCGIRSEENLSTVGGDGEESREERLQCRQHELNFCSNEINRPDVITSCDLTSNSEDKFKSDEDNDQNKKEKKDCPRTRLSSCSTSQSTCSEGSYSRRRHHKHHKHHKHKQKSKSPVRSEDNSSINPKVNPIFLWVRQENTRIVEVMCEDYDHRNRLRLTRTQRGWRAIPKTKCFAEAIIPKAKPKEIEKTSEKQSKPKQVRKMKKSKKSKKSKKEEKIQKPDNPTLIKECSVALCRDDLENYRSKISLKKNSEEEEPDESCTPERSEQNLRQHSESEYKPSPLQSRSPSKESLDIPEEGTLKRSKALIKSKSCDFQSLKTVLESLPRSISLDLKIKRDNNNFKVQNEVRDIKESDNCVPITKEIVISVKNNDEVKEGEVKEQTNFIQGEDLDEIKEGLENQRNHSESIVMDMTKHDSDFNDTDCDELGQLLKDIPDLEFVEEEELEEMDEDEWSMPTDLTIPKTAESIASKAKLPVLPPSITPVVTVTPSAKPPEPLTAPLPEVTITPIPNPKPAHQQKPQNNFLESLLSTSRAVKSESEKNSHKIERKSVESYQCERKAIKHYHGDVEHETKNKKLKVEDITLKNLLSKNQNSRTIKSLDLETCVKNLKAIDGDDCTKSRLQELLTESINSDPISQLKEVLSNPHLAVPDPLLVPRARLPALVASPASEIPRLLSMHLEKAVEETPCPPLTDSDLLEVSLSNLQSLLSCSPEKLKSANNQDLANYQKSLETILEWQRYQTELMEAQMKSSKSLSPGFPGEISDMAAATAFSQMLWLPYLNQLDFNCNANRDFLSLMNSVLTHDYQANCSNLTAPPQINISQVPQPSPFLTPTSPMDLESHLKTLAMWQEAIMMQQNSQTSRACTKASSNLSQDMRRNAKTPNIPHHTSIKKQSHGCSQQPMRGSSVSPRGESMPNGQLGFEIYQDAVHCDYQKKHSRQNTIQYRLEEQQKQMELHQKYKQEQQNQFRKMQRSYSNYQAELMRQSKMKKPGPAPGSISVKPLSNLIDKNNLRVESKNSWEQLEELRSQAAAKYQQPGLQNQKIKTKEEKPSDCQSHGCPEKLCQDKQKSAESLQSGSTDTPKLKVKNLVDPNMSPPKLLKQIAPEHLPMIMEERGPIQDDPQANLWHPLFGSSNQIKSHPYNSPWRWTTVTVNGE